MASTTDGVPGTWRVRGDAVTGGDSRDNARGGHVDFRILGPLEAINEAGPVELTGGKQKALLALLLLHADRVVAVDANRR